MIIIKEMSYLIIPVVTSLSGVTSFPIGSRVFEIFNVAITSAIVMNKDVSASSFPGQTLPRTHQDQNHSIRKEKNK